MTRPGRGTIREEVLGLIADDAVLTALAGSKETTRRCQPVKEPTT